MTVSIGWVGAAQSTALRHLRKAGAHVSHFSSVNEALSQRGELRGICVDISTRELAFRAAERNDGLAGAVGWCDTLAFAGGLPGAFGFCCRVGGLVQAIRQRLGDTYVRIPAVIVGGGSEAAAAMAAFTQLRTKSLTLYSSRRDALTLAVAHRMGIDLVSRSYEDRPSFPWADQACDAAQVENQSIYVDTDEEKDTRFEAEDDGFATAHREWEPREAQAEGKMLIMDAASGIWGLASVSQQGAGMTYEVCDATLSWQYTAEAQIRLLA